MQRDKFVQAVPGTERQASQDMPSASCIYKAKAASEPKPPTTLFDTFMQSVEKFSGNDCEWRVPSVAQRGGSFA